MILTESDWISDVLHTLSFRKWITILIISAFRITVSRTKETSYLEY